MSKVEEQFKIAELIALHLTGGLNKAQEALLNQWINGSERNADLFDRITDATSLAKALQELQETDTESALSQAKQRIAKERNTQLRPVIKLWPRIAAAASIILCLSAGGYFLLHKKPARQIAQNHIHDIAPGSDKAILKLANGKQIVITGAKNGLLAQQGNTTITKTANGPLTYSSTAANVKGAMLYDTLIVPRGGQHQVKFADGSIAYLNADTKLRIPENFQASDRTVELISGEADFHVVHNAKTPFMVKAKGLITKDIGTEFNINAYPDEPAIKTTLLEGSVKVSRNKQSITLQPGQQAVVQATTSSIKVNTVDTDEAFAWKNGKFLFSSTPLGNIMRQLSRWYDVDVVYQDDALKAKPFSAISTRFTNVSQVLHDLELTGDVKFKIEGKTIKVLNK